MCDIKLDDKIMEILACPFCRCQDLKVEDGHLCCSTCYARFKVHPNGVVDFRVIPPVRNVLFERYWIAGQEAYEQWAKDLPTDADFYRKQIRDSTSIYTDFCDLSSINGVLLDIGGSDGRLRHFLPPPPQCSYVSIDPYLTVREDLSRVGRLEAYPVLANPCDFICGMAEHLPFISNSVDFVRMNSVLDHLWDAHLGMREVVRVLKPNGLLFLGISIVKEMARWQSMLQSAKDLAKVVLRRKDHHVWHPTRDEVDTLVDSVGLNKVKEIPSDEEIRVLVQKTSSESSKYLLHAKQRM